MNSEKKKKKYLVAIFTAIFMMALLPFALVFAQTCPNNTTVSGTVVTFVGQVVDLGGDSTNNVWFEYGTTLSYGQATQHQTVGQTGIYCITVSGFSPCTTYHYKAVAQNSAGTSYGEDKSFTTTCTGVSVDLTVNGLNSFATVLSGSSATLSWTSTNASYCTASGAWSGTRSISGSETINNINSSETFTLTCYGGGGSSADSVTVNVGQGTALSVSKLVRNLSNGTPFAESVSAKPGDVVSFSIQVQAGNNTLQNVSLRDVLPSTITWRSSTLKVDGVSFVGDIISGINLGSFSPFISRTVTFDADIQGPNNFTFGQTQLTNTATAYTTETTASDNATIFVTKSTVAGTSTATGISTGLTNNIWLDSILIPLLVALILVFIFKNHIFKVEEWYDTRKSDYRQYKSNKILREKIMKSQTEDILGKR